MYSDLPHRTGDVSALADEFLKLTEFDLLRFNRDELDPHKLVADDILAVHMATAGAQGEPGAINILYRSPQGLRILHGNFFYGNLDFDAVTELLPMLKNLDGDSFPPFPFGGKLENAAGWKYMYLGSLNHFFGREMICKNCTPFMKKLMASHESFHVLYAVAWYYLADQF